MIKKKAKSDEVLLNVDDDPQLPFESINLNDNIIPDHNKDIEMDTNDSQNIEQPQQSKLSKLSTSITTKIKATKMKRGGFEKIQDNEDFSDKDDMNTTSPMNTVPIAVDVNQDSNVSSYFDINCCGKTYFQCTKRKTIFCIASIVIFFLILFLLSLIGVLQKPDNNQTNYINCMEGRKVLIISLDGFRAEYLQRIPHPNMEKYFEQQGVAVNSMKSVYPSKVKNCLL